MSRRIVCIAGAALIAGTVAAPTALADPPPSWVEHGNIAYGEAQPRLCPQHATGERCVADNGINPDIPKLYDNRTLQRSLEALSAQLGGVAGVDQSSLLSRIANVSGGSLSQTAFNLQLAGAPIPGVTTTAMNGSPSIAATTGLVTGTAPTGPTSQATNQVITTTPSNTVQTQTTQPTFNPVLPTLPSASAFAAPSNVGPNALGTLAREMELNYQIFELQLLLQGSLGDDYSVTGQAKRHVTLGFPIEIDSSEHKGQVAQVEISVCNPAKRLDDTPPSIQTLLPEKRSYDVVSVTNHSTGLGAGAIVSAVSLGASFLWSHQTFYLVQDQDTVALQTQGGATQWARCPLPPPDAGPPIMGQTQPSPPTDYAAAANQIASQPATFAWRFLPVLGNASVESGDTTTFAQIALAPSRFPPVGMAAPENRTIQIAWQTCWYAYDAAKGVVGSRIRNSCTPVVSRLVPIIFDTTKIDDIEETDNGDGTLGVRVEGAFPYGTAVDVGEAAVSVVDQVVNRDLTYLRFTVPVQAAATHGVRIVSPDGAQQDVELAYSDSVAKAKVAEQLHPNVGPPLVATAGCAEPRFDATSPLQVDGGVTTADYSDTVTELTIDYPFCNAVTPNSAEHPPVVVIAGKAFGMSDAPFEAFKDNKITVLVPNTVLQGQSSLTVKRLFLGKSYEISYAIDTTRPSIASLSVLDSDDKGTTYLAAGTLLGGVKLSYPTGVTLHARGDRFLTFTLPKGASVKQLIFQPGGDAEAYFVVAVPSAGGGGKSGGDDTAQATLTPTPLTLNSPAAISVGGANLSLISEIDYLGKPLTFLRTSDSALTIAQPAGLSAAAGVSTFKVVFKDGSSEPMDVTVKDPGAK